MTPPSSLAARLEEIRERIKKDASLPICSRCETSGMDCNCTGDCDHGPCPKCKGTGFKDIPFLLNLAEKAVKLAEAAEEISESCEEALRWLIVSNEGRKIPNVNGQPGGWMRFMDADLDILRAALAEFRGIRQ